MKNKLVQVTDYDALLRDNEIVQRLTRSIDVADTNTFTAVESLVHLLKTYGAVYEQMNDRMAPHGLSVAKLNLLIILYHSLEYHLPMSEIGERMSVTRTNITKLVDLLERDGLVERAAREGDRRVVLAQLTAKGLALITETMPAYHAYIRAMWHGLNEDECRLLTHLLLKLRCGAQTAREEWEAEIETPVRPDTGAPNCEGV